MSTRSESKIPAELKYTDNDEWVRLEGDTAVIGITDYAQDQLSDIVFVEYMLDEAELVAYPYVDIHWLCDHHNLTPPKRDTILESLREIGFRASRTHFQPTAILTDAPIGVGEETVRRLTGA